MTDPDGRFRFPFLKVGPYELAVAKRGFKTVNRPMHQNQYGLSLGGPIAQDRTFVFANVEQRDLDQSGLTTITDANVDAINGRLAATGYPGSAVATGAYPNPVHTTLGLAKLDHHAGSHQLSPRYSFYRVSADNSRGAGGLSAPSASAGLDNIDHAVSFSDSWVLSGRTVNETRVLYAHGDLEAPPFAPRVRVDDATGAAAHPQLAAAGDRVVVVWDQQGQERRSIRARTLSGDPKVAAWTPALGQPSVLSAEQPAAYPAVAATPTSTVVAWTEETPTGSEIRVRRLGR